MLWLIPCLTIVACGVSLLLYIGDLQNNPLTNECKEKKINSLAFLYAGILTACTVVTSILFCTVYKDNSIFISIKRMALLSVIWPVAYIDFKSYRIPNSFIIMGLACRLLIFPFELIFESNLVWMHLLSEVIAAVALLLASGLCSLCIKNSIGFGDMKLFIVMGLLLSLDGIWGAIFLSLIISFIVSAYLLISKKKNRKDAIPFGPALVIGTYLSVCLSGM